MSLEAYFLNLMRQAAREAVREELAAQLAPRAAANASATALEFLTYKQACQLTEYSKNTLRKYAREGKLQLSGEARATRIRRSELEALMTNTKSGDDRPDVATQADVIIAQLKRRG